MVNQRSIENLKHFPKGVSGNPRGNYKRTKHHARLIEKYLREKILYPHKDLDGEECFKEITREEAIILGLMAQAQGGDARAYNSLIDRWAGKLTERHEVETREVEEFASEEEARRANQERLIALQRKAIEDADDIVGEATGIINKSTDED